MKVRDVGSDDVEIICGGVAVFSFLKTAKASVQPCHVAYPTTRLESDRKRSWRFIVAFRPRLASHRIAEIGDRGLSDN